MLCTSMPGMCCHLYVLLLEHDGTQELNIVPLQLHTGPHAMGLSVSQLQK